MSRNSVSTLLTSFALGALSLLYVFQWRAARIETERVSAQFSQALSAFEKKLVTLELASTRAATLLRSVIEGKATFQEKFTGSSDPSSSMSHALEFGVAGKAEDSSLSSIDEDLESLPLIPEGTNPVKLVADLDIKQFFEDTRFNPEGKLLTRPEKMKALHEVTWARATMEILDSEVRTEVAAGIETLRAQGEYVEYLSGQRPQGIEGVVSASEDIESENGLQDSKPSGSRVFYFHPEGFANIYRKKKEKEKVAEVAVRRLLALTHR